MSQLSAETLVRCFHVANTQLFERAAADLLWRGAGASAVAVLRQNNQWSVVNVGATYAYLWRNDRLRMMSVDHTLYASKTALPDWMRDVQTQILGGRSSDELQVALTEFDAKVDDRMILCSHTVHRQLGEARISQLFRRYGESAYEFSRCAADSCDYQTNVAVAVVR